VIRKGQRFRALRDLDVICLTQWRAPATFGDYVVFPSGETFQVLTDPPTSASAAACLPERAELEARFVPENERDDPKYNGYHLSIGLDLIARDCEALESM